MDAESIVANLKMGGKSDVIRSYILTSSDEVRMYDDFGWVPRLRLALDPTAAAKIIEVKNKFNCEVELTIEELAPDNKIRLRVRRVAT